MGNTVSRQYFAVNEYLQMPEHNLVSHINNGIGRILCKPVQYFDRPTYQLTAIQNDKIKGLVMCTALGDAMGMGFETLSKEEIRFLYRDTSLLPFNPDVIDIVPKYHELPIVLSPDTDAEIVKLYNLQKKSAKIISNFKKHDWTDDTDQLICIMQSIVKKLHTDYKSIDSIFSQSIYNWINDGFPECGDNGGCGVGTTTKSWYTDKFVKIDPYIASCRAYLYDYRNPCNVHPNGALMRTAIVGTYCFNDLDVVFRNAITFSKITHASPKCVASSIFMSGIIALLMRQTGLLTNIQKTHMINTVLLEMKSFLDEYIAEFNVVIDKYCHIFDIEFTKKRYSKKIDYPAQRVFPSSDEIIDEIRQYCFLDTLDEINLNHNAGYTMFPIACSMYAFRNIMDKSEIETYLVNIIKMGGDTDSNCAVVGAVLGTYFGYSSLPMHLLNFPHLGFIQKNIDDYLRVAYGSSFY